MDTRNPDWRFFTKPFDGEGVAGHLWSWAKLDGNGKVVDSGSGFYTVIAAVRDARTHGFDGPDDPDDPDFVLQELGDRRAFDICTS